MRLGPALALRTWQPAAASVPTPSLPTALLKRGMRGEPVRQLQQALVRLGHLTQAAYATGPGQFGPATDAALRRFQQQAGLKVDGIYGPRTRQALTRALTSAKPAPTQPAPSKPAPTGPSAPSGALSTAADATFTLAQLWPYLQRYGAKHGADPKVLAGMVAQESTFTNWRVHRDGTGHGLIGLDDHGMLPDFEKWADVKVGRGRRASIIAPELQLEYLAVRIGELSRKYGSSMAAARAWHRGPGPNMWDAKGSKYANLIQGHIRQLFG